MKMACYGDNVGSVATLCTSFSWLITSQSNTYGKVYNDNLKIEIDALVWILEQYK
jgi:hypothetical protein